MTRIIRLQISNFMRLIAVDITPDGFLIPITGRNAEGKSSVINAIWAALQWRLASHSIQDPIRHGQDTAKVTIDLGDLVVTRTWNGDGSKLQVTARDGAQYKSPQSILDKFVSEIGFDPLEFVRMQPRDQREMLMNLLKIDFTEFEKEKEVLLKDRLEAAQNEKSLIMRLQELPVVPKETPDDEVSAVTLIKQIQDAQNKIASHHKNLTELEYAKRRSVEIKTEIEELEDSLLDARERLKNWDINVNELEYTISLTTIPDPTPLQEQLTNIEQTNKQVRIKKQHRTLLSQREDCRNDIKVYDDAIQLIDKKKRETLAAAQFPVPGLSFDESGILLNGVPFAQASSAEQIRVSLAMGIAMNPDLKVLLIRDGNALDSDSLKMVEQMAKDADMQVWMERVDESGEMGICIEDGSVRKTTKQAVL